MINNFRKFQDITLENGEFLFVQIIQRSKDNPTLGANNRLVKYYCIESYDQLLNKKEDIITLCESMNARAYIHYTPRTYTDVHKEMLFDLANRMRSAQSDRGLRNCFSRACGISYVKTKKTWVVDVDDVEDVPHEIIKNINSMLPDGDKVIDIMKTKSGFHLITKPFNCAEFYKFYPELDIHKNNPTILYI